MKIKVGQLKRIIREEAARLVSEALNVGDFVSWQSAFGNDIVGRVEKVEGDKVFLRGKGTTTWRDAGEVTPSTEEAYKASEEKYEKAMQAHYGSNMRGDNWTGD